MRRTILHIGTETTGTTRGALRRRRGAQAMFARFRDSNERRRRTLSDYMLGAGPADEAAEATKRAAALRLRCAEFWHFRGMAPLNAGHLSKAVRAQVRALAFETDPPGAATQHDQFLDWLGAADAISTQAMEA